MYPSRTSHVRQFVCFVMPILFFLGCSRFTDKQKQFQLLSPEKTGIHFNNQLTETHEMNIISYPDFYSGAGVSVGDIDNDGFSDVFFTGNQVPVKLYKNLGGMVFEDITVKAGLGETGRGWITGTCMVDINTDGFLDIYISKSGIEAPDDRANLLFLNNRDGTFTEVAKEFGLDSQGFGVNAVFFDYDKDGDLDAYLANQVSASLNSNEAESLRNVIDPYAGDKLYENIEGKFIDVTKEAGLYSSKIGFAHGAAVGDINDDGWDDLFVSNDFFEYDYLYLNNGDKTFTESLKKATKHISNFSMGNDMADYNNDGLLDIVVLDMVAEDNRRLYSNLGGLDEQRFSRYLLYNLHYQYMFNVLHLNNGNETFSDVGMIAGISRTDWSWAPLLADFDNDGLKDLFVTNGIRKDIRNQDWGVIYRNITQFVGDWTKFEDSHWKMLLGSLQSEPIQNYMFHNNGDLTFSKVTEDWGFNKKSYSNGVAYGDLDNDGDLDLVINNIDDEAFVYENKENNSNYIRFKFIGSEKNPMALGTKVRIYHGDKFQYQQHYISRGYRSSMEPVMHFGIGTDTLISRVEVVWPDGKTFELTDIVPNKVIMLNYKDSSFSDQITRTITKPIPFFENVTDRIGLEVLHKENQINDFMRDPMLPYKLSSLGPAFDVADVNGDSLDDFYLGGSYRFPGQLLIQTKAGGFVSAQEDLWKADKDYEDVGASFFDVDGDGDLDLYVVTGGNEINFERLSQEDRLYLNDGKGNFVKSAGILPGISGSGSVAKPVDFDKDGDQDLFVGGRITPESYPLPTDSYLLINQNGKLENATERVAPELMNLGMVTDAVWSDYDSDGDQDLIIVGEWMPITLFQNDSGKLTKIENKNNGLEFTSGWWWGIQAADIDNDGDDDFIVGNMGLNYKFNASKKEPLELFAFEPENKSKSNFIMAYHQDGNIYPTCDLNKSALQNPNIKSKILSNDMFAVSTIYDIYGKEAIDHSFNKKIYTLASGYLLNKGKGIFEFIPFDNYAQLSNINSIAVRDVDSDGNADLIMAGNHYDMEVETIRMDAGIGIMMKGDDGGHFRSVPYANSGLYLDGDVRALRNIKIGGEPFLIAVKNNDFIQIIKINSPN